MINDQVFILNYAGVPVWKAIVDDRVVPAEFNSKGAALAAIQVERRRMVRRAVRK
jgi:hypothetical protein